MDKQLKDRLRILCEDAATQENPERLMELVREIDRLLGAEKNAEAEESSRPRDLGKAV